MSVSKRYSLNLYSFLPAAIKLKKPRTKVKDFQAQKLEINFIIFTETKAKRDLFVNRTGHVTL